MSVIFFGPERLDERRAVVQAVIEDLRFEDRVEAYAVGDHRNDDEMRAYLVRSDVMWGAFPEGSEIPAAVGGLHEVHSGVAQAWILGTHRFPEVSGEVLRFVRRKVIPFLRGIGFHRMESYIWQDNRKGRRWLKAAGATEEGVLRRWGRNREDFVPAAWYL